jgi:hypothetical protein
MERVKGRTMRAFVTDTRSDKKIFNVLLLAISALTVLRDECSLAYHGDYRCDNILVTNKRRIVVLDFEHSHIGEYSDRICYDALSIIYSVCFYKLGGDAEAAKIIYNGMGNIWAKMGNWALTCAHDNPMEYLARCDGRFLSDNLFAYPPPGTTFNSLPHLGAIDRQVREYRSSWR